MAKKAKAMTAAQVIGELAAETDLPKKAVEDMFDSLAYLAQREAKNGFKIPGIGKLVLVNRKARTGRNPATGEPIQIPARKAVKFRVSKACKEAVLGI